MRKFIIKIFVFAILMISLDIVVGYVATYLIDHAKSGATERMKYICEGTTEDVLIMGSSRGMHHYNPTIIQDSTGMSCFNCGYEGCGSVTAYGLLSLIAERYSPKILIYEVTPNYDYLSTSQDNSQYLGVLKHYFNRNGIDSIFIKVNKMESIKMNSQMYRINSQLISLSKDYIRTGSEHTKGFIPIKKKMVVTCDSSIIERSNLEMDPLKADCLNRVIAICKEKKIKLFFSISPSYNSTYDKSFDYAKALAKEHGIPILDYYADSTLSTNIEYFSDPTHLNHIGADVFTRKFVSELKSL